MVEYVHGNRDLYRKSMSQQRNSGIRWLQCLENFRKADATTNLKVSLMYLSRILTSPKGVDVDFQICQYIKVFVASKGVKGSSEPWQKWIHSYEERLLHRVRAKSSWIKQPINNRSHAPTLFFIKN